MEIIAWTATLNIEFILNISDECIKSSPEVDISSLRSWDVGYQHLPAPGHPRQPAQGQKLRLLVGKYQQGEISLLPDEGLAVALGTEKLPEEKYCLLLGVLGNIFERSTKTAALQDWVIIVFCSLP